MPRLRIRRRPIVYWSLTGALALVTGLIVSGAVADSARRPFGLRNDASGHRRDA